MTKVTLNFETSYDFDIADIANEITKLHSDSQGLFLKMFVNYLYYYCDNEPCKIANQIRHISKEIDQRTFQFINELSHAYRNNSSE